nr:MAG TPA: hypothetical protein [Caudoviricetes sp.]DAT44720.1 MAG TPA: hypothetical protein [Caudoviricetes sp.]DAZ06598.1 MAG TPA: hypothetical protein [Caudoviricetes sp.]DAZ68351.1 MAG TPA: hypothetical protein [Caudoviricetes sp.]
MKKLLRSNRRYTLGDSFDRKIYQRTATSTNHST